ncbi:MAG TPA: alternative ribosome rescue aminoacyl-tRNA hydrolase ArfB [Planktothrix sp.]|jgi:ribosome-associated protein
MLSITPNLQIPLEEFEFTYARSGGPGGQNVNKVNSKAVLRWRLLQSQHVSEGVRERFVQRFGNRLTVEGELVISSQRYRDQAGNVQDCLDKLQEMLAAVAVAPVKRRPTRPTLASKTRRVTAKREQSQKKAQRQLRNMD